MLQPAVTSMGAPHTGGIEGLQHEFSSIEGSYGGAIAWTRLNQVQGQWYQLVCPGLTRFRRGIMIYPTEYGRPQPTGLVDASAATHRPPEPTFVPRTRIVVFPAQKMREGGRGDAGEAVGQLLQEEGLGHAGRGEVAQVQRLVDAVRTGVGVADRGDQDRRAGERVGELGDERDGAALADQHRFPPPGAGEGGPGGVGDRALEGDLGRLARVAVGDGHLGAPGRVGLQVVAQAAQGPAGVVAGSDPQADLGPGARDEGVRRPGDRGGVEGDDRDRRAIPQAFDHRAVAEVVDALQHPGLGPQPVGRVLQVRPGAVVQPGDGDVALVVVQGGQQPAQGGQGIGRHAPVRAGVDRVVEGPDLHHAVGQPPQRGGERGLADGPVAGVGDHVDVGGQPVAFGGQDRGQGRGADLLLALDEHRHADRGRPVEGAQTRRGGRRTHPCRRWSRGRTGGRRARWPRTAGSSTGSRHRSAGRRGGRRGRPSGIPGGAG